MDNELELSNVSARDRLLAKQVLPIEQIIFALKRYQCIVSSYPKRVEDIDRHITNVVYIGLGVRQLFSTTHTAGTVFLGTIRLLSGGKLFRYLFYFPESGLV